MSAGERATGEARPAPRVGTAVAQMPGPEDALSSKAQSKLWAIQSTNRMQNTCLQTKKARIPKVEATVRKYTEAEEGGAKHTHAH